MAWWMPIHHEPEIQPPSVHGLSRKNKFPAGGGRFDFVDAGSTNYWNRFYRRHWSP